MIYFHFLPHPLRCYYVAIDVKELCDLSFFVSIFTITITITFNICSEHILVW